MILAIIRNAWRSVAALAALSITAFFGIQAAYSALTQNVTITVTVPANCALRIEAGESAAPAAIVMTVDGSGDMVALNGEHITIVQQKCNDNDGFDIDVASSNDADGSAFVLDDLGGTFEMAYTLDYGATTVTGITTQTAGTDVNVSTYSRTSGWDDMEVTIDVSSAAAEAVPDGNYDDVVTFTMSAL